MKNKVCSCCKETLSKDNFNKNKYNIDGLAYYCRNCVHQKLDAYNKSDKGKAVRENRNSSDVFKAQRRIYNNTEIAKARRKRYYANRIKTDKGKELQRLYNKSYSLKQKQTQNDMSKRIAELEAFIEGDVLRVINHTTVYEKACRLLNKGKEDV